MVDQREILKRKSLCYLCMLSKEKKFKKLKKKRILKSQTKDKLTIEYVGVLVLSIISG